MHPVDRSRGLWKHDHRIRSAGATQPVCCAIDGATSARAPAENKPPNAAIIIIWRLIEIHAKESNIRFVLMGPSPLIAETVRRSLMYARLDNLFRKNFRDVIRVAELIGRNKTPRSDESLGN
jgi:hypothetical protein